MELLWNVLRVAIVAVIVVTVAEVSKRSPRLGAVLLSLPIMSVLAFQFSWFQHHDLPSVSRMARDTLVLVPLGLPFFLPFALADRLGWNYWSCLVVGLALATAGIGTWLTLTANR
jgi:predicted Kef-type K+ transport protein